MRFTRLCNIFHRNLVIARLTLDLGLEFCDTHLYASPLDTYIQAQTLAKRKAQQKVVEMFLPEFRSQSGEVGLQRAEIGA